MVSPKNDSITNKLAEFYRNLYNYQIYHARAVANQLKQHQYSEMLDVREWLVQEVGQLGTLITELTGKDMVTLYEFGQQRSFDMWAIGLRLKFDENTSDALSICVDYTNRAIGKLRKEIEEGYRNERGKVIGKRRGTEERIPPKAFVSHGKESAALRKLKEFLETLGIEPLIVKKRASLDKDLPDKVNLYLSQADFVIILATADDTVKDKKTGTETKQPRQNVIHEIGLAQKTHEGKVIYLLEEGAEFPSNIRPKVWENFKQRNMMDAFLGIVRELRAYGMLKCVKP